MPASPLYDRLTEVAQLDYSDPDSGMITNIQTQITSLREACTTFSQNLGVQGATRAALEQRVSDLQTQLDVLETRLQTVNNAHTEARAAMTTAKTTHGTLSPVLLTARDRKMAEMAYSRESPTFAKDVEDHLRSLAVQRNTQREAAAQAALDTMNADVTTASSGFTKEAAEAKAVGAPSTDSSPEQSPSGRNYPSIPSGGRSGSTDGPIAGVTTLPSVVPSSSVLAGVDVTTMPIGGYMTADGPVGGYVPAPVTDANDPRWHSDDDITGVSSRSRNLAISGGALSTGGVLAGLGRMSTMTTSVGSSMGALASRAASSQFGTVPAGGKLAPSTSARLSSSNVVSRVLNDLERGAITPRGTAQAGNWGNAARSFNTGAPPAAGAARTGSGFPRGIGAPGATGTAGAGASAQGGTASTNRAATMSARARAAASIRPAGGATTGTTGTTAAATKGGATGAKGTAASASRTGTAGAKGAAGTAKGTSSAAGARTAGVGPRGATTAQGAASTSTRGGASSAKGGATASAKGAASAAKAGSSSASTGVKGSAATAGGNAAAGASAGRAASSTMGRGALGGIPAATASKEEKERAKRQALAGFKAVRVDGVEEQVPVAAGLSAGSAAALKPVAARDQGDQW
jgi:major ampullate spidroin 1 (fragment)